MNTLPKFLLHYCCMHSSW